MLRRLALPIGVVLLLVAIALVSLRLGYLGRKDGGPLKQPTGFDPAGLRAVPDRWTVEVTPFRVDGGRVRISAARVALASPGMRIRGPRLHSADEARFRARRWPPRGDLGRALGARIRGRGGLAFGALVRRPGTYLLWRYQLDYEQGARSYRRTTSAGRPLCVARASACPLDPQLPDASETPLADIGGPSDYGARVRRGDDGDLEARIPAREGAVRISVPLTNLSGDRIDVRDLLLKPARFGSFTLRSTTGAPFALEPGESRVVTVELAGIGCSTSVSGSVDALTAEIDGKARDVPLLVRLTPVAAARC